MSDRIYPSHPQVSTVVYEEPWAILRSKHDEIRALVARAWSGEILSDEEIQARVGTSPARRDTAMAGSVALIPVYGVITPKADLFTEMSGGTSVQRLQGDLRAALADKDVTGIVLDVNSPGGTVDLLTELAAEIRAAREEKPIVAVANTMAASAAYWIAAQADEVIITPSGQVGSIGIYAAHEDISGALKEAGVTMTLISSKGSPHKTEGTPYEPLSAEAKAEIQRRVDESYDTFVADVAAGRGTSEQIVRDDFGQGRMLTARKALRAGMVDGIGTYETTVARLMKGETSAVPVLEQDPLPVPAEDPDAPEAAASGLSFACRAEDARRAALALVGSARSFVRLTGVKREQLASLEASHREVADTIAELLTEHQSESLELDETAEAELAWTRSRLPT